jgi:ribosomal protein L11 methyltransferase
MLRRVSVTVPAERAEVARARMIQLFPQGFEERESADGVELAAYTDGAGEERLWQAFGGAASAPVGEGWEERWREFHRPATVGPLWIGPPWLEPPAGVTPVFIDPGRAFGTGGHPTTRLCLELLLGLSPGSLLDVGCGSGVIAIAAAKLGFAPVVALDVDESAVEAARRNARANGVSVDVRRGDALDPAQPLPAVDVAVANLTGAAVEELAPRLDCSWAIASGYLEHERPRLESFAHARRVTSAGWAADALRRTARK